jgi:hypothetical protein
MIGARGTVMKWAKERDSLIAQTRAFVNSVITWKAETAPSPGSIQPVAIENTFAAASPEPDEAVTTSETTEPTQAVPTAELPSVGNPSVHDTVQNDLRKEIQSRVAAFQAHQHRFAREREAHFKSVLAKARSKARSALDGDDSPHNDAST